MLCHYQNRLIAIWLGFVCAALIAMIIIGGYTRLVGAGLSVTEWRPITGVIPPFDDHAWNKLFALYKDSPEYINHNYGMSLIEFKMIFWIEFIHRIAARITVLLYIIPMFVFWIKNNINSKDKGKYIIILLLLFLQGLMGWLMVKSGLKDVPYVSHYRLAIHLLLAFIIYSFAFWQMIQNYCDIIIVTSSCKKKISSLNVFLHITIFILFIQIILGALVAGLHAGLVYNSFPLMGNQFIPHELITQNITLSSFNDPIFVQFIHRINAYILFCFALFLCMMLSRYKILKLTKAAIYIMLAISLQMILGIITIIYLVPISIALMHQAGSILLLSTLLYTLFLVKNA